MKLFVFDATGRHIGTVRNYSVFSLQEKKVFEAKPKTTFKEIVTILQTEKPMKREKEAS